MSLSIDVRVGGLTQCRQRLGAARGSPAGLFQLYPAFLDHPFPFRGFLSNHPAEISRGASDCYPTELRESRLDLCIREPLIDRPVEGVDDFDRRALGNAHAEKGARLIARHGLSD